MNPKRRTRSTASRVRAVRVEARAKLNLGLAVGPRRADGYHEVATVYQSITLADTLVIRPRRRGFRIEVRCEEAAIAGRGAGERVPAGADNLVLRAARLLQRTVGFEEGANFRLVKRVPVGAGLGGGSGDAAAALVGLERLMAIRPDPRRRQALAAELGSDVPFACRGGTAIGLGRGERLQKACLSRVFRAIVAVPWWRISTASAYREIDRTKYSLTGWGAKLRSVQSLGRDEVTAIQCMRLGNTFEAILGKRREDFVSLSRRLRKAGLRRPRLTGSGSAVFGILRPGMSVASVIGRFNGNERLYAVKSARTGLRVAVDRD